MNRKQQSGLKDKDTPFVTQTHYPRSLTSDPTTIGNAFNDPGNIETTNLFSTLYNTKLKLEKTSHLLVREQKKNRDLEYDLEQVREHSTDLVKFHAKKLESSRRRLEKEIATRRKIESELKNSYIRLANLGVYQEQAKEEERKRIAREIHDELGSALTALKMDINWINDNISQGDQAVSQKTEIMSDLIVKTIQTVQRISRDLRPRLLDDLGLAAAIEWQAEEFSSHTGIDCDLNLELDEAYELSPELNTCVFRITQELLTNIARHSQATRVAIRLTVSPAQLVLQVKDNGVGITASQINGNESFGLIGISERLHPLKGELDIQGKPDQGTKVTVHIPLTS